ncbi:MAG: elongation factor G [bacterium]
MKEYSVGDIRSIALVSHSKAGKTSLAEAIAFDMGITDRLNRVDEGNSIMDYSEEEINRRMSIGTSILSGEWKGHRIYIVDTPGYMDFIGDVLSGLRAVDSAAIVIDATMGIEPGTEKVWNLARELNLPCLFFVNKMDKENADFSKVLSGIREKFGPNAVPFQLPLVEGGLLKGIVDVVRMKSYVYDGGKFKEGDVPDGMRGALEEARVKIVEAVAEMDEALMEKYFDEGTLPDSDVERGLRAGVSQGAVIPVFCGSAYNNIAVHQFLDAVNYLAPSPADRPDVVGTDPNGGEVSFKCGEESPFSAFVFKTIIDPYMGRLNFFRIFSGRVGTDSTIYNSVKGDERKVGHIYEVVGKDRRDLPFAKVGDIVAVAKLEGISTGDTLCSRANPIVLPQVKYPEAVMFLAVEPKSRGDEDKMSTAISRILEEDPTLHFKYNEDTRDFVLSGMGRIHLDVVVEKLQNRYGVGVNVRTPRVPYRETIRKTVTAEGKYKKQTGGHGQYGHVFLRLEPLPPATGFEFASEIVGGVVPKQYIPGVEKGVVEAMNKGVLAGYPVVDVKVVIYDGSYHSVDSSELAFKIAASMAFKDGAARANPVILEPIMNVYVTVPEECMGDVIGDLNSKRGQIVTVEPLGNHMSFITATVPMAEMFEYEPQLRSITSGRGTYRMEFLHYQEVPQKVAEEIIAKSKRDEEQKKQV